MTSPTGCDGCQDELDLFAVSNRDTGQAQFLGPLCLFMFGATMLISTDTDTADTALKVFGYQPTAATRKARKDAEAPDYDPNRTIAAVVADKPEPPAPLTDQADMAELYPDRISADPDTAADLDECPICGAMVLDSEQIDHMHTEHPDLTTIESVSDAIRDRTEGLAESNDAPPY